MAFYTDTIDSAPRKSVLGSIATYIAGVGATLIKAREASLHMEGRVDKMAALQAKSDEELAAMGLRRDDIVRHVFRDLYYI